MTDLRSELTWLVDDYISLSDVIESDRGLPPNTATRERAKAILFMTDWQPIETSPRDGTSILICGGLMPDPFVAEWDDRQKYWKSASCIDQYYGSHDATHWMPLPDPPKD